MNKIRVGTKLTILNTKYVIKNYKNDKEEYYVVEALYGGNLNGTFSTLEELIVELENLIGRWTIRLALKGTQLNFEITEI